jgi:tubulin--tyrosine ligase/tubulin polyglutamylase TTLL9
LSYTSNKNYWIVKPVDLYQGKCIEILNNYQDIIKTCQKLFKGVDKFKLKSETTQNNNPMQESEDESEQSSESEDESSAKKRKKCTRMYCSNDIVIQKYLDNPLLYNKRKFDIRCYVLVDHNLNVFFCREGHLKGSSEEYDLNITNKFVHITNHSLQKMSENFEKYEYGNEMSYNDFKMFLQKENIPLCNFDKVINEMKYLVEISMNSIGKRITTNDKYLSFEIFGYDFIIDNKFKTWILEINNNPGLGISSPVIEKLVPRMLDDAFRLTIDNVFETIYDESVFDKEKNVYKSKYHLDGFDDSENVFEFICNIMNS